ncbi:MAG: histidinol-phosphatase [Candidatus Binataceae bacterium]
MSRRAARRALPERQVDEYLAFACRLAELAGDAILPHFRTAIEVHNKAGARGYDPVTIADRAAEESIRREIARRYPSHGIHGEELGKVAGRDSLTWVIDPIDGTRSFIIGQLHWGTLIALNDGERPILGVMHQPYVGETFTGSPRGAHLRRAGAARRLRIRRCPRLENAVLCTTHPELFTTWDERSAFGKIAERAKLTRYGGDCYSYCLLAAGLVDLVIEAGLYPYDVQALIPIVEGAGGVMTSWAGETAYEGGQVVAAGDPKLHRIAVGILSRAVA